MGLFLLAAAPLVAACGSEVNQGGTGGTGGAGGTGGTGGTGGSMGEGKLACMDFCHIADVNNCTMMLGDCTAFCDEVFADAGPECEDEYGALFECYLPAAPECPDEPPVECNDESEAAQQCQMENGCVEGECYGSSGPDGESGCGCNSMCKGASYSTSCTTPGGGGMTTCTCSEGDTVLGTCTNEDANACGVQTSCCAQFFNL